MTVPLPTDLPYGYVDGLFILAGPDSTDTGRDPDGTPLELTVTFTATDPTHTTTTTPAALVVKDTITCTTNAQGVLVDATGAEGVWLVAGAWIVSYSTSTAGVRIKSHSINVTAEHTDASPLHLSLAYPPAGEHLSPSEFAVVMSRIDNLELGVTAWDEVTDKPATFPPTSHAASHATGGSDPITPESIGAFPGSGGGIDVHVDDIQESGAWWQNSARAIFANGYPVESPGTLVVLFTNEFAGEKFVLQRFTTEFGSEWVRTKNGSVWRSWFRVGGPA